MEVLFAKILNMSLTGSIVIAVVLLARLVLKGFPKRYSYLLWGVVLFRLLCPISLSSGFSVLAELPVNTTPGVSTITYAPVQQALQVSQPMPTMTDHPIPETETKQTEPKVDPMEVLSHIWIVGAAVMAISGLVQYLALRRRLIGATRYRGEIYLSDYIDTPFVMGVLRPRVYLPSDTPREERRFIIAHERHHIRRFDPLWKLLGYTALSLHWFNPLVWAAFLLAGKDMEMSCDEAVLRRMGAGIRADYSQALLRLATHKKTIAGMPLAFGEGDTRDRVRNMARWKTPKVWVSVLCLVLCLVILAACALNPKQEEKTLEEMTRVSGPAGIGAWELYFTLPEGCTYEMREKDGSRYRDTREGCVMVMTDGTNTIGGITAFPIPTNYSEDNWDWFENLDLPEWKAENIGYMAEGQPGNVVTAEFFSDVPPGQECTVLNEHNFFFYDGWIYDLWFDKLTVKPGVMTSILKTLRVGEAMPVEETSPEEIPFPQTDDPNAVTVTDTFFSEDGTVQFHMNVSYVPETLQETVSLEPDTLFAVMKQELKTTTMDGYGLPTKEWGYTGVTCDVYPMYLTTATWQLATGAEIPTVTLHGTRIYHFSDGNSIGQDEGIYELMTLNALDGTILESFGRLD